MALLQGCLKVPTFWWSKGEEEGVRSVWHWPTWERSNHSPSLSPTHWFIGEDWSSFPDQYYMVLCNWAISTFLLLQETRTPCPKYWSHLLRSTILPHARNKLDSIGHCREKFHKDVCWWHPSPVLPGQTISDWENLQDCFGRVQLSSKATLKSMPRCGGTTSKCVRR